MQTLVAVHGAWAGGYYWTDVAELIEQKGYPTRVVDQLPSVGADPEALGDLAADAAHVRGVVDHVGGPVTLVGHSYGGMVVTELADHPAVQHSVYVAAFWPDRGQSALDLLGDQTPEWMVPHDDGTLRVSDDAGQVIAALGADVDPQRATEVYRRSLPQSLSSVATPSTAPAHSSPTTYVVCEQDRAVPPAAQEEMARRADHVARLPTSHWAMFAAPEALAAILVGTLNGDR